MSISTPMMLKKLLPQENNIYVSIGEDGVAVFYFIGAELGKKIFIRTTSDSDTIELKRILLTDPGARIHIYLDTIEQTYNNKTLPAISVFSIEKLAAQRLEKEVPKDYLKAAIQVGRTGFGRNDWIFMFVSTPCSGRVAEWIKFFNGYQNIIQGIHFLPVELCTVANTVKRFRDAKKAMGLLDIFKRGIPQKKKSADKTWEVLVVLNKSGGFRQAVFQNGRIIFTRLLDGMADPNQDVIAGNIEQEIINSIEYLKRIYPSQDIDIFITIIISSEIKKSIRRGKFNVKGVQIYTPYEAAKLMMLPDGVTNENDRFCDPLILTLMHTNKKRVATVHTKDTGKMLLYSNVTDLVAILAKAAVPVLIFMMFMNISRTISMVEDIKQFSEKEASLLHLVAEKTNIKNEQERKLGGVVAAQERTEIVNLYNEFTENSTNPVPIMQRLGSIMPNLARVSYLEVDYVVPNLIYVPTQSLREREISQRSKYGFSGRFVVYFQDFGNTYEELRKNYNTYVKELQSNFKEYSLKVSSLPADFTLSDFKKPFYIHVSIQTPSEVVKP